MALKSYALTTVDRVRDYLGLSSLSSVQETVMESIINATTEYIERYTGRHFKKTSYENEEYDGGAIDSLVLKNYPVFQSPATFSLGSRGTSQNEDDWTNEDAEDYFIDYEKGIVYRAGRVKFKLSRQRWRVSYTAGYDYDNTTTFLSDTAAGDVELVAWFVAGTLYTNRVNNGAARSETLSKYSISYGSGMNSFLLGLGGNKGQVDIMVSILDNYRRGDDSFAGAMSPRNY